MIITSMGYYKRGFSPTIEVTLTASLSDNLSIICTNGSSTINGTWISSNVIHFYPNELGTWTVESITKNGKYIINSVSTIVDGIGVFSVSLDPISYCIFEDGTFNYGVSMSYSGSASTDSSGLHLAWDWSYGSATTICNILPGDISLNKYTDLFNTITIVYTTGTMTADNQKYSSTAASYFYLGEKLVQVASLANTTTTLTYDGTKTYDLSTYNNFANYIWVFKGVSVGFDAYMVYPRGTGTFVIKSISFIVK